MESTVNTSSVQRASEILGDREAPFIATAVEEHRGLMAERAQFLLRNFTRAGWQEWRDKLFNEVVAHLAAVDGEPPEVMAELLKEEFATKVNPVADLEQVVVTIRTDRRHRLIHPTLGVA